MMVLAVNPFVNAYLQADWFGKGVFWSLFLLSAISCTILLYKCWQVVQVRRLSREFVRLFSEKGEDPLNFQFARPQQGGWAEVPHPFFEIYKVVKGYALQLLNRNRALGDGAKDRLSSSDLELIELQMATAASFQCHAMEKNLFILSTVVTLGPFLGLLGTVWGILTTFSQLPHGFSTGNAAMLTGLSMALATTVIGLVVAIPALVGYNYLKNASREYRKEVDQFSHLLLATVEIQYRRDD